MRRSRAGASEAAVGARRVLGTTCRVRSKSDTHDEAGTRCTSSGGSWSVYVVFNVWLRRYVGTGAGEIQTRLPPGQHRHGWKTSSTRPGRTATDYCRWTQGGEYRVRRQRGGRDCGARHGGPSVSATSCWRRACTGTMQRELNEVPPDVQRSSCMTVFNSRFGGDEAAVRFSKPRSSISFRAGALDASTLAGSGWTQTRRRQAARYDSAMNVDLAYGRGRLSVEFPDDRTTVLEPSYINGLPDEQAAIRHALRMPLGDAAARVARQAPPDRRHLGLRHHPADAEPHPAAGPARRAGARARRADRHPDRGRDAPPERSRRAGRDVRRADRRSLSASSTTARSRRTGWCTWARWSRMCRSG